MGGSKKKTQELDSTTTISANFRAGLWTERLQWCSLKRHEILRPESVVRKVGLAFHSLSPSNKLVYQDLNCRHSSTLKTRALMTVSMDIGRIARLAAYITIISLTRAGGFS